MYAVYFEGGISCWNRPCLSHMERKRSRFSSLVCIPWLYFWKDFSFFFLNLLVSALSELLPHGDKQEVHCARDFNGSCPGRVFGDVWTGSHSFQMCFWSRMCLDYIILFSFLWGLTFPSDNIQILRFQMCLGRSLPITDFAKLQSLRRKVNNTLSSIFWFFFFCLLSFTFPQRKVICVLLLFVWVFVVVDFWFVFFWEGGCFSSCLILFLFRGSLFPSYCWCPFCWPRVAASVWCLNSGGVVIMETGAVYQTKNNKTKQKGKKEGIKLRPSQQPDLQ